MARWGGSAHTTLQGSRSGTARRPWGEVMRPVGGLCQWGPGGPGRLVLRTTSSASAGGGRDPDGGRIYAGRFPTMHAEVNAGIGASTWVLMCWITVSIACWMWVSMSVIDHRDRVPDAGLDVGSRTLGNPSRCPASQADPAPRPAAGPGESSTAPADPEKYFPGGRATG